MSNFLWTLCNIWFVDAELCTILVWMWLNSRSFMILDRLLGLYVLKYERATVSAAAISLVLLQIGRFYDTYKPNRCSLDSWSRHAYRLLHSVWLFLFDFPQCHSGSCRWRKRRDVESRWQRPQQIMRTSEYEVPQAPGTKGRGVKPRCLGWSMNT